MTQEGLGLTLRRLKNITAQVIKSASDSLGNDVVRRLNDAGINPNNAEIKMIGKDAPAPRTFMEPVTGENDFIIRKPGDTQFFYSPLGRIRPTANPSIEKSR